MTPEEGLAAAIKLVCALLVLRWPLAGALASIAADVADVVIMNYVDLGGGGIRNYHVFDKLTDVPAMITFGIAALRFEPGARRIAMILFSLRMTGIVLFEVAGFRRALFLLPNLFEVWFLFVLIREKWLGGRPGREAWAPVLLVGLTAGKLVQEYVLHLAQFLDRYSLYDVVERILGNRGRGR
ncbi:MAG: hypothetical protein ACREOU_16175 [Candidatus Eiseniibacteriota bacterium]